MAHILIIEDSAPLREGLAGMLRAQGHRVAEASDGAKGLAQPVSDPADVIVTDLIMPGLEGLEMIRRLRHRAPDVPIVAISGGGRMPACGYLQMASKLGAVQTLAKPFARNEFIEVLTRAMQDAALV